MSTVARIDDPAHRVLVYSVEAQLIEAASGLVAAPAKDGAVQALAGGKLVWADADRDER